MSGLITRIRKMAKFQIWVGCIIWFISLPSTLGKCHSKDISISTYPQGDIYVRYGEPLEIYCVVNGNYSANDIQIMHDAKVVESEIVNGTTRRLYIEKPEKQISTIYCHNLKTGKRCTSRVLIDSPPKDITDFHCISKNVESLNCSWTSPEAHAVNYELTFAVDNHLVNPSCKVLRSAITKYCVWNTWIPPRYRQLEEKQHFYLSACNVFGCNNQNFTIDHFSIVKPDRPYNIRVVTYGSHNVELIWRIPDNIVDFLKCGVDHKIQYQIAQMDNKTYFRTVNTSQLLPTKRRNIKFNLTDLPYSNTQYEVRISIKSKLATSEDFWSDYSFLVFNTLGERPTRPPKITAGEFDQIIQDNERVINVYWQNIEKFEESGPEFTYKVDVLQGNVTKTIYPAHSKSYVSLKVSLDALDVTVWSVNMNGSSVDSSHIYIPPEKDTRNLKINFFRKVAYENGTYELLWDGIKDIDNYTLFWCKHNGDQMCSGRIDFGVLNAKLVRHVVNLPREDIYQFAISANSGINSGGMTWAKIYGSQIGDRDSFEECLNRIDHKN